MASNFWEQLGILLIGYLPKGPNSQRGVLLISSDAIEGYFKGKQRENFTKVLSVARQRPASPGTCNPDKTGLTWLQKPL
jgi:hypothetical protein